MTETTIARSLKKSRSAAPNNGRSKLKAGVSEESAEMRSLQLLEAVRALRDGDFSVRLPVGWVGTDGQLAEAFNQALAHQERITREVTRLSVAVGKEGRGSINILIVDDEPKNLTVLETVLSNPAYRLIKAESADQALLALLADEFALLILDIRMPGVTGIELAKMIKERKKTSQIPIIFSPPTTTKTNTCWKAMAPELWISCTSLSTRTSCARRLLFLPSSIACNARSKSPT